MSILQRQANIRPTCTAASDGHVLFIFSSSLTKQKYGIHYPSRARTLTTSYQQCVTTTPCNSTHMNKQCREQPRVNRTHATTCDVSHSPFFFRVVATKAEQSADSQPETDRGRDQQYIHQIGSNQVRSTWIPI